MIHLDTHVVLWLSSGEHQRLSSGTRALIRSEEIAVSPMVVFELGILHEIGRIRESSADVVADLRRDSGLVVEEASFADAAQAATHQRFAFTRDPFDRLIAAHAYVAGVRLLTKDERLREHLDFAVWP